MRLLVTRLAWLAIAALALVLYATALPARVQEFERFCLEVGCELSALTREEALRITKWGLYAAFYTSHFYLLEIAWTAVWVIMASLIFWRSTEANRGVAFLSSVMFLVFSTTYQFDVRAMEEIFGAWWGLGTLFALGGWYLFQIFCCVFPDGRFVPRWTVPLMAAWAALEIPIAFFPDSPLNLTTWPPWLQAIVPILLLGATLYAPIYRYRYVADPLQRQQTKWVLFGLSLSVIGFLLGNTLLNAGIQVSVATYVATLVFAYLLQLAVPVSFGFAIMRYRLWEIDLIINRTLVYGSLTAVVTGLYLFVVLLLGLVFQAQGNLIISLVGTGLVAILVNPLRVSLQQATNRLMYGDREEPYKVMTQLSQRLGASLQLDQVLPTIIQAVKESLKLPYAAILLREGDDYHLAAEAGEEPGGRERLPLVHREEMLGYLVVGWRSPGEPFSRSDLDLLEGLARQASMSIHASWLTRDLQRSRERLVTAREDERRRLRRDLHDGLGPALGAQTLKVGLVKELVLEDPKGALELLDELEQDIASSLQEVRRLVYNLRPPTLDEWGLIGAVRRSVEQLQRTAQAQEEPLEFRVEAPPTMPVLPAAVEVAAFRITQEAITNVVRHARARRCEIIFRVNGALEFEVTDDGVGLPRAHPTGVGLISMRERATELGGACLVEGGAQGGTRVFVRLPLHGEGMIDGA